MVYHIKHACGHIEHRKIAWPRNWTQDRCDDELAFARRQVCRACQRPLSRTEQLGWNIVGRAYIKNKEDKKMKTITTVSELQKKAKVGHKKATGWVLYAGQREFAAWWLKDMKAKAQGQPLLIRATVYPRADGISEVYFGELSFSASKSKSMPPPPLIQYNA